MTKFPIYPSRLRDRTIELLRLRCETVMINQIAADTGLSKSWLFALKKPNAKEGLQDVGRIEVLYTYLSGKQLEL